MTSKNNKRKIITAGAVREIARKYGRIVFEQSFKDQNGTERNFFLFNAVEVPAIVLPLTFDNKVVAIRQFRYGAGSFVLEIPGGNSRKSGTPEDCAKAEIMSETGYRAEEVIRLGKDIWFDPASSRTRFTPLIALGCRKLKKPKLDSGEIIETIEIPVADWLKKIEAGKEILDSKTLAITALAFPYLNKYAS